MVADIFHVRRKDGFILGIDPHGQMVPPHKRQRQVCSVIKERLRFQIGFPRVKGNPHRAPQPMERFRLSQPTSYGTIRIVLNRGFHGSKGGGPVMLRPVEFNAAGNPRSGQSHQRWLNHRVLVDELIAVVFALGAIHFPAKLRQQIHLDVLVGKRDHVILHFHRRIAQLIADRDGIYPAACSLIGLSLDKIRHFIGLARHIGKDGPSLFFTGNAHNFLLRIAAG